MPASNDGPNVRNLEPTAGMSVPEEGRPSQASGDSYRPALMPLCAAMIAEYDRRLAAAGGLEAVREATVPT
jgi:hypothetical protein